MAGIGSPGEIRLLTAVLSDFPIFGRRAAVNRFEQLRKIMRIPDSDAVCDLCNRQVCGRQERARFFHTIVHNHLMRIFACFGFKQAAEIFQRQVKALGKGTDVDRNGNG